MTGNHTENHTYRCINEINKMMASNKRRYRQEQCNSKRRYQRSTASESDWLGKLFILVNKIIWFYNGMHNYFNILAYNKT